MNVVFIMSDTLRRDHLGCYGNKVVRTPCLDKFAAEAHVFDRAYFSSYPTVPNRSDILTGRLNFTYSGWARLADNEVTLGQVSEFHGVGGLAATAPLWLVEHQAAQESYAPPVNGMYAQSL